MYFDFQQFTEAVEHLKLALTKSTDQDLAQESHLQLAECYLELRRYEDARQQLENISETPRSQTLLARALWQMGQQMESRNLVARALASDPENTDALMLSSEQFVEAGDDAAAIRVLERLKRITPSDHDARYQLALAYQRAGQPQRANDELHEVNRIRELYDRLTEYNRQAIQEPQDAAVRREIAELWSQLGDDKMSEIWDRAASQIGQAE